MMSIVKKIQDKAIVHLKTIQKIKGRGFDLTGYTLNLRTLPAELNSDGRFFVITGNRNKPEGIMDLESPPDLVFLYNDDHGVFINRDTVLNAMRDNRESLEKGIDKEYEIMGVWLNLGILSPYLDENLLELLSKFS